MFGCLPCLGIKPATQVQDLDPESNPRLFGQRADAHHGGKLGRAIIRPFRGSSSSIRTMIPDINLYSYKQIKGLEMINIKINIKLIFNCYIDNGLLRVKTIVMYCFSMRHVKCMTKLTQRMGKST